MKFTIGTVSGYLEFTEDINLIKSSLLYADEIEMIGMIEYAVFKYLPNRVNDAKSLEELMTNWVPFLESVEVPGRTEILTQIRDLQDQFTVINPILRKKKKRTKQEILAQMQAKKVELQIRDMMTVALDDILKQSKSDVLKPLVDNNIITVFDYGYDDFDKDKLTGGYFGNLIRVMQDGVAYPLFDKMSTDVIKSVSTSGILDIGNINPEVLRHAGVATNILMTLPTLEAASFDELIDLKREHNIELQMFRKAVYEFSEKIASLPWDENFQYDCLKLYQTDVFPKVQEINEVLTDTSILKNMGRKVLADEEVRKKMGFAVGGLISAITTSSTMLNALGTLKNMILSAALIGISPAMATAFLKTVNLGVEVKMECQEKRTEANKNVMYYYYLASKIK